MNKAGSKVICGHYKASDRIYKLKMKTEIIKTTLNKIPKKIVLEKGVKKIYFFEHKGSLDLTTIEIEASQPNGEVGLKGSVSLKNKDDFNLKTLTTHFVGDNKVRIHIKAVLDDQAKLNFDGMINIEKGADFADSFLQQDNLLISDNVVCNSAPQLQIKANEVKASHGVTMGSFDPNQLFYLKSRGLSEKESKKLLIEGFLANPL